MATQQAHIPPEREIRAAYDERGLTVYQAYSDAIADSALDRQTFVSPPFSMTRMTWIKPSFLWMMYRSGWARKDAGQTRILAIEITHAGLAWALANSCPSHPADGADPVEWRALLERTPVRIQWDPERDLHLQPLPHRAIQIGLKDEAVQRYASEWILAIRDVTDEAQRIHALVEAGDLAAARAALPLERPYSVAK
jgi:hypothetical protein